MRKVQREYEPEKMRMQELSKQGRGCVLHEHFQVHEKFRIAMLLVKIFDDLAKVINTLREMVARSSRVTIVLVCERPPYIPS